MNKRHARNSFQPMTAKSMYKLVTYVGAFYCLQVCAGLIGGIAYALTPLLLISRRGRISCGGCYEQRS